MGSQSDVELGVKGRILPVAVFFFAIDFPESVSKFLCSEWVAVTVLSEKNISVTVS